MCVCECGSPSMLLKGVDIPPGLCVPESDSTIISSRHDETAIRRESGTPHPVTVATECVLEPLSIHCPHLCEGGGGGE